MRPPRTTMQPLPSMTTVVGAPLPLPVASAPITSPAIVPVEEPMVIAEGTVPPVNERRSP